MLYPLKFSPILKETIWGGDYLYKHLGKGTNPENKIGESWEISSVKNNVSVIANGELKGISLTEAIKKHKEQLVGNKIYEAHGEEFPVLIKFIDAQKDLSVQVHPNEEQAQQKYNAHGKTEMWYVIDAERDAKIIAGFDKKTSLDEVKKAIEDNTIEQLLRADCAQPGDVFFIPAGRVHAIGAGNVIIEIQQTSDITFRVYDYDRQDAQGNRRELHVQQSLEVMNTDVQQNYKTVYDTSKKEVINLTNCPYFTSNFLRLDKEIKRDYSTLDSYVILICTSGAFSIVDEVGQTNVMQTGESVLLPASIKCFSYIPKDNGATIIETYIE